MSWAWPGSVHWGNLLSLSHLALLQEAKVAAETAAEAKSMFLANSERRRHCCSSLLLLPALPLHAVRSLHLALLAVPQWLPCPPTSLPAVSHEIRTPLNGMIAVAQVGLSYELSCLLSWAGCPWPRFIRGPQLHTQPAAAWMLEAPPHPCPHPTLPTLTAAAGQRADARAAGAGRHHPGERQHAADHPGRHPGLLQGGLPAPHRLPLPSCEHGAQ